MIRLLLTAVLAALAALPTIASAAAVGARKVDVGWGKVEGASGYEIEVARLVDGERVGEKILAQSSSNRWVHELPPGRYRMRVRSLDEREVAGVWSDEIPFDVAFPPVETKAPAVAAVVQAKRGQTSRVAFAWKAAAPGLRYRLEVYGEGEDEEPVATKVVKGTRAALELPVAEAYSWQVIPLDDGKPLGEALEERPGFEVHGAALAVPRIDTAYDPDDAEVEWTRPAHAETFKIKLAVQDLQTGRWRTLVERARARDASLAVKRSWPLGRYSLEVIAEAPRRAASRPLVYGFTRELTEDRRLVRPTVFLRAGLAPTLLRSTTAGIEPEPDIRALVFTAYDLLARWGHKELAVEAGYSLRSTTLFPGGAEGGGDMPQPPLSYDASRAHAAVTYFLPIGGRLAVEPFLGAARRTFVLLSATPERTLATSQAPRMAAIVGADLTARITSRDGLRGRGSLEQILGSGATVRTARYLIAEGTYVRSLGDSGFTLAAGYSLSRGDARIVDAASGAAGRLQELQQALLMAVAFAY